MCLLRPCFLLCVLGLVFPIGHTWAESTQQSQGFPLVTSYSAEAIGADPTSWSVVQDGDGRLYFGCRDLVSFDGDRWQSTSMDGANAIRGLDFSSDGQKLWAGAVGEIGWFSRTSDGDWRYKSLRSFLPPGDERIGEVWYAFAEPNGVVFVSDDRILRWNGTTMRVWSMPGKKRLLALKIGQTIYVQQEGSGLYTLQPNGPQLLVSAATLGNAGVFWIEPQPNGWLMVTSRGLFLLANGKLEAVQPEASKILQDGAPTCAARLPFGRLAVGTFRSGIVILGTNGELVRVMGEADGLPTRLINSLYVDRDQQLWATSYTHIIKISASSASTIFDWRARLPNKPFDYIAADAAATYAATDDAVYRLPRDSNQFSVFEPLNEHVGGLHQTSAGLISTGFQAVRRIDGDAADLIYATSQDTFVAISDNRDDLLIGEARRIIRLDRTGSGEVLVENLPDTALSLARDTQHRLWIGTLSAGILMARTPSRPPFAAESAKTMFPSADERGLGIVRRGQDGRVFLISSNGAWISRADPADLKFDAVENYPARTLVAASDQTQDGKLWLIHSGGGLAPCIGMLSINGGRPSWRTHSVEGLASIGIPRTIYAESLSATTTVLWIGGTNGILRHIVAHGLSAPQPRPPLLRAVARNSANDVPQAITGPLPYSTRSIEFEFAEPDFTRRAALRLQTRVVGIDREWMPADPTSRQILTAVRDGRYTFQVRAVAETGISSLPATFKFEVLPPWYRTTTAVVGGLFGLIPLGYGFYRLRVRALRRHNAELEEKVHRRTEELERASAAKTQFVANMSHDIRNPLNGIVGLTLALDDTRLEKRQREIVATLRECATYLSTLVDDVLDFASIEAGRVELRNGPFVPHELLRSIVTTVKADTAERGAVILVEADPSLPASVLGDAGRVQQILINYVSNALKYAGGHICLSACVPADSPGEIEFSVADEGPGISEAEKATLFTKFNRLSRARREDIPGSGLGLAACRLLADHMGGSVGVDSEPGRGARFYLRLPLSIAPVAPEAPQDLPNTTVLVVEDTDYNAWAASAVLAKLGLTCERARTGEEALRLFRERRFNVVLLDRNLPDLDGTEVARQMRAMESDGLQAVLLAVTAYCTAEDRALCLKSGMDAFVGKPLTPEKLRKVLLATGRRQLAAASVHVSPEVPTGSTLDLSLLKYLSNGKSDGLETEITRYIARLDECLAEVTAAIDVANFAALARAAHDLQGHAKLIGAAHLASISLQLEHTAAGNIESGLYDQLRQITVETHALKAQLHRHRSSAPRA